MIDLTTFSSGHPKKVMPSFSDMFLIPSRNKQLKGLLSPFCEFEMKRVNTIIKGNMSTGLKLLPHRTTSSYISVNRITISPFGDNFNFSTCTTVILNKKYR